MLMGGKRCLLTSGLKKERMIDSPTAWPEPTGGGRNKRGGGPRRFLRGSRRAGEARIYQFIRRILVRN